MNLIKKIESAGAEGFLLNSSVANLKIWASSDLLPEWVVASITELVEEEEWEELNDRFYQNMTFGTGGIRGRTIGKISTSVECGKLSVRGTPEHAAVGTNALNDFNLIKVIIGLYRYAKLYLKTCKRIDQPRIVIAHDVRHFSRHFCELAASTWTKMGGQALIFDGPRSTPQLSFAVRQFKATCGAVITASHNPPHDNGFKVYFEDGAQVISEHAEGIVAKVNDIVLEELSKYLDTDLSSVVLLGEDADTAYINSLSETVLNPDLIYLSCLT